MSADAQGHVYRYAPTDCSASEMLVLLAIADTVNDQHGNKFWMSMETLANKTRLNRRTTGRVVAKLVEDKWLELLTQSSYAPSEYRFLFDESRPVTFEARREIDDESQTDHRKKRTTKVRTDVAPTEEDEGATSSTEGATSVRTNSIELKRTQSTQNQRAALFDMPPAPTETSSPNGEEGRWGSKKPHEDDFNAWYEIYPRKRQPQSAFRAYVAARKTATADELLESAKWRAKAAERLKTPADKIAYPATFLNTDKWRDWANATAAAVAEIPGLASTNGQASSNGHANEITPTEYLRRRVAGLKSD